MKPIFHPQKRIILEIHWKLHLSLINEPTFEELWNTKKDEKTCEIILSIFWGKKIYFYI